MEPQPVNKKSIYLTILVAFLILFLLTALTLLVNQQLGKTKSTSSITSKALGKPSNFTLKTTTGSNRFPVGQNLDLNLLGDPANENIVGWDLLITYDSDAFNFISANSILPDFKFYVYKRQNYILITSIKSLQSTSPTFFTRRVLGNLVFQAKKKGTFNIKLVDKIGNLQTDYVNTTTKKIYPQLNALTLEIY